MKASWFIPCLLLVGAAPLWSAEARPNFVYIIADDLGLGDVQALNPQRGKIKTPHLDRLAAQAMVFTDAHSGSSVCTPTRYGLLTGRYAWRTRLQRGVLDGGNDEPLIAADRLTVPGFLRQQGYATACLGKWHLGFQSDAEPVRGNTKKRPGRGGLPLGANIIGGPTTRGFDYFWGCSNARTMAALIENDRVIEILPPIEMLPRLTEQVIGKLGELASGAKSGKPFFLYVPLTSPHAPVLPSPAWQGKSGLGAYGDFVQQTDDSVGRILAALEQHEVAGNTLVIFTSDNGCSPPAAGTDQLEQQGHFASAGFRGYKADIWDGGHRVPFFVRWPGQVPGGTSCDELICHTDLLATCADILGSALPPEAVPDSVSFYPALRGERIQSVREAIVHHSVNGKFSIRQGKWKLNFCGGSGGWGKPTEAEARQQGLPPVQLYDMAADPGETNNLFPERRDEAVRLAALLEKYIRQGRSTGGAPQANDVAVAIPQLDAASR